MDEKDSYFDLRQIREIAVTNGCAIKDCRAKMETAPSQWGEMPFCPQHFIRIHPSSRTFVYYNGHTREERKRAAARNILFNKEYFVANFLDKTAKAESHRIGHETSEDALSWNVFSELYKKKRLSALAEIFTSRKFKREPELFLWGRKISSQDNAAEFPQLKKARSVFEGDLTTKFVTEPDVMLYVPGEALILIEAKFTSKNPVARDDIEDDDTGEKPKSKAGIIKRYRTEFLNRCDFKSTDVKGNFLSQMYRNLIFASYMAGQLNVEWSFCNLLSREQIKKHDETVQRVKNFYQELLSAEALAKASVCSWEQIYEEIIAKDEVLDELKDYMLYKTANLEKAFDI